MEYFFDVISFVSFSERMTRLFANPEAISVELHAPSSFPYHGVGAEAASTFTQDFGICMVNPFPS
jgi:hypothetical protein